MPKILASIVHYKGIGSFTYLLCHTVCEKVTEALIIVSEVGVAEEGVSGQEAATTAAEVIHFKRRRLKTHLNYLSSYPQRLAPFACLVTAQASVFTIVYYLLLLHVFIIENTLKCWRYLNNLELTC